MPGFSTITGLDSIMFADNVSFDGTKRGGAFTADGDLLIGSTAAPHIKKGNIAAGTNMSVTPGSGSITVATSLTPTFTSVTVNNAPLASTDATNKAYVDAIAAGFDFKDTTVAGSTGPLTATYFNGVAGVGATLTNSGAFAVFSLDGQSPTVTQRVLIKDQANAFENGIYVVTDVGDITSIPWVLTRASDYDTPGEMDAGSIIPIQNGTVNVDTLWLQNTTVGSIGTDAVSYQKFQSAPIVTTQHSVLIGDIYNKIASLGPLTNGQLVIGNTGNDPSAAGLTPGTGIAISSGAGSISISSWGGGLSWTTKGVNAALVPNNGFIANAGAALSFSLPASSSVGDVVALSLDGATSWTITQGANQQIRFGSLETTLGAGGSLTSTAQGDTVHMVCVTANLRWIVISSIGNVAIV